MKLLYIDACIRGERSRTKRIAEPMVSALAARYDVQRICLDELSLSPVGRSLLEARYRGEIDGRDLAMAECVRDADLILIAAPFWDMSFPSVLKVFFERCSILGVTFLNEETRCVGNCRAKKMIYVTTRGMDLSTEEPLEQATPYLRALSHLWGIGETCVISAQNLDYVSEIEAEKKIQAATEEGLALIEHL